MFPLHHLTSIQLFDASYNEYEGRSHRDKY